MKIERINAYLVEVKLGFSYAMGTLESSYSLVWEYIAGPHVGFGEAAWASKLTGPAASASTSTLISQRVGAGSEVISAGQRRQLDAWVRPMIGRDVSEMTALLPSLPDAYDDGARFTRDGLSVGLYDLAGKAWGVPAHALLGGKRRATAPGMPVVHVGPPEVMVRRAKAWLAGGYRYLKVKLAGSHEEDVERFKAIRAAIGPRVPVQVDANEGYPRLEQAERAIKALQPLGVDLFEDMLDAPLADLALLRQRTGARIMVDKQGYWPNVFEVCRAGAADVINHHPNIQGGLDVALQIDAVASAAGIPTAIGSCGMVGVQNAAYQSLSTVVGVTRPCEDVGLLPYFNGPTRGEYAMDREPNILVNPYPIIDGMIHIPDAPGLGVEINRRRLEQYTKTVIEFA